MPSAVGASGCCSSSRPSAHRRAVSFDAGMRHASRRCGAFSEDFGDEATRGGMGGGRVTSSLELTSPPEVPSVLTPYPISESKHVIPRTGSEDIEVVPSWERRSRTSDAPPACPHPWTAAAPSTTVYQVDASGTGNLRFGSNRASKWHE